MIVKISTCAYQVCKQSFEAGSPQDRVDSAGKEFVVFFLRVLDLLGFSAQMPSGTGEEGQSNDLQTGSQRKNMCVWRGGGGVGGLHRDAEVLHSPWASSVWFITAWNKNNKAVHTTTWKQQKSNSTAFKIKEKNFNKLQPQRSKTTNSFNPRFPASLFLAALF